MGELTVIPSGANTPSVQTVGHGGSQGQAMMVENSLAGNRINKDIQFNIVNAASANKLLRIGSVVSRELQCLLYGLTAGAEGSSGVSDQTGAKVLAVQGFGLLTTLKPVIIDQVKIQSSDDTQLNTIIQYKALNLDATVDTRAVNTLATQDKSDNRTNLNVINGNWILDATNYLEMTSYDAKSMNLVIRVAGYANVAAFVPVK